MSRFVGIDPGKRGAIAFLTTQGDPMRLSTWDGFRELVAIVSHELGALDRVAVESVHAQPKFGAKSSFEFGRAAGALEAILIMSGVRYEFVPSRRWQAAMLRKQDGTDTKRRARECARRLWPRDVIDAWTQHEVDAALIAEWLRRRECSQ